MKGKSSMSIISTIQPALTSLANVAFFVSGFGLGILSLQLLTEKFVGYWKGGGRTFNSTKGNRGKQRAILVSLLVIFVAASAGIWFAIGAFIWATYFLALTLGAILGAIVLYIADRSNLA
jgi:hypothetical protein